MKLSFRSILNITSLVIALAGCTSEDPALTAMPVIEAWINSGGHPVVQFTSTVSPSLEGGDLMDALIKWGKVTISDGEKEIILTGKRDSNYFPPYKYFTNNMIGTQGKTYTITAQYNGMYATATATMHKPTPISRITVSPIEGNDTLRSTLLHFIAPDDVPAYYYLTVDDHPSLMGWCEVHEAGQEVSIPVYNYKQPGTGEKFVAQFAVGESHIVALNRVDREVYEFWRAYDDSLLFGNNVLFGAGSSLPTNVKGGFGVFSVRATDTKIIEIQ